jgi:hypothetical protein
MILFPIEYLPILDLKRSAQNPSPLEQQIMNPTPRIFTLRPTLTNPMVEKLEGFLCSRK